MIKKLRQLHLDILLLVGSAIGLIACFVRPFHRNNMWYASLFFNTDFFRFIARVSVEVEGIENLEAANPAVIISNHQSSVDATFMTKVYRRRTVVIGKKELKWIPFFGQLFWLAGNILIDRSNRVKAVNSLKKVADIIKKEQVSIWIMPEGTRSRGKKAEIKKFKKGAFYTAISAEVPIVIISVNHYSMVKEWNTIFKRIPIKVKILPPIPTKGLDQKDVSTLLEKCQKLMESEVAKLSHF